MNNPIEQLRRLGILKQLAPMPLPDVRETAPVLDQPESVAQHKAQYGEHACTHSVRQPVAKSYQPGEMESFLDVLFDVST